MNQVDGARIKIGSAELYEVSTNSNLRPDSFDLRVEYRDGSGQPLGLPELEPTYAHRGTVSNFDGVSALVQLLSQ